MHAAQGFTKWIARRDGGKPFFAHVGLP
jgi:hypothetical protein